MEKRLILAIALSIIIIVTFQHFIIKPQPPSGAAKVLAKQQTPQPATAPKEPEIKTGLPTKILSEEKEIDIETDRYIVTFSNVGGSIRRIRLKDYKDPRSNKPFTLAEINNPKEYLLAMSDPLNTLLLDSVLYEFSKKDNIITYSTRLDNIEIIKRYILHKSKYIIELQLVIKNVSDSAKAPGYRIISGSGISEPNIQDRRFIELRAELDGKTANFKRPKTERIINPGLVSWTALKSKYFSIILKPSLQTKDLFYGEAKDGSFVSGIEPAEFTVPPNSFIEHKFILYAGPSQISTLREFGLEGSVDYGFFGGISKVLLAAMRVFYLLVRSWGIAIILLSIFLNLILFPLSLKSFKSMQKMQELHPQMEKLKSQFKDNPQKLNKEIMELYKKNNINPLSGCLPMLLQMPIFIALYNALIRSIELRCASFLWIKDLSMPDAVKIPLSLPLIGSSVNILPLVMVVAMVLQQKISTKTMGSAVTAEQRQQQQMMLIIMPIMFGFIFYNMPSGLVLYWVINTVLTIVEQAAVFKKA